MKLHGVPAEPPEWSQNPPHQQATERSQDDPQPGGDDDELAAKRFARSGEISARHAEQQPCFSWDRRKWLSDEEIWLPAERYPQHRCGLLVQILEQRGKLLLLLKLAQLGGAGQDAARRRRYQAALELGRPQDRGERVVGHAIE